MKRSQEIKTELEKAYTRIVELEKGYEFYFPVELYPQIVEWVNAESRYCPFGKYQITIEPTQKLTKLYLGDFKKEDIPDSWIGMKEWIEKNKSL